MEFLLEIMTEEMPPSHIPMALKQIRRGFMDEMAAHGVSFVKDQPRVFGTCRRLILWADLVEKQPDREKVVTGPPKSAAFDPEGNPTKAALGFARSRNVDISALEVVETGRGEYVAVKTTETGRPTAEILAIPGIWTRIISTMTFPKAMRWGENPMRFTRPIKSILCLFGGQVPPIEIGGIKAGDRTTGHRLHFPESFNVGSFKDYTRELRSRKVIIDFEERKAVILDQMAKKMEQLEAEVFPDPELLDKMAWDVERPLVILGSFPKEYLRLPLEVLSTAMKKGQNLFSVVKGKKQIPFFLGVADAYRDAKSLIRKGNERVLVARLEDARFFWEEDTQVSMKKRSAGLAEVVFQEKLGTYLDKALRLKKNASYLADRISKPSLKAPLTEAAALCKADLITDMVREFPSLQGQIGGLYLKKEKYPEAVWRAVYEHYLPGGVDDPLPSSLTGVILSLADKLDSIVGVVGLGVGVTGSRDPFGLRRNALGICRIILEKKLDFSFSRMLDQVYKGFGDQLVLSRKDVKDYCRRFFKGRLQHIYEKEGFRYDLVKAALEPGMDNILHTEGRLKALDGLKESPDFEPMIQISKRVNNILKDQPKYKVNPDLLKEKQERELHTSLEIVRQNIESLLQKGEFARAQKMIFRMKSTIHTFFDKILVMAEDLKLRRNRLALLQEISDLLGKIADYSLVVLSD
jgi:glycyl-tRNA synthetase beta chain